MEQLGRGGLTISVCCGPSGGQSFRWSVFVGAPNGDEFNMPYAANSFEHAIEIAELEAVRRQWLPSAVQASPSRYATDEEARQAGERVIAKRRGLLKRLANQ
jgi:hypothetical protein